MRSIRALSIAAAVAVVAPVGAGPHALWVQALVAADTADKPAKAAEPAANPLEADDPFVGEFSSEEMLVIVRLSVDGFVGEIRRGGRTFPMKAAVEEGKLSGAFTHGETSYKLSASLEGDTLKVTTGTKVYSLKRKGAADAPATPVKPPVTPAPPVTPTPTVPVTPSPDPGVPVSPKPALSGPHLIYAQMTPAKLRDLAWARFPIGAHAEFEESVGSSDALPKTMRRKLVFMGTDDGRLKLRNFNWDGTKFDPVGQSMVQPEIDPLRIDNLGYAKGATVAEDVTVQGVVLRCQRTQYSGEATAKGATTKVTAEVWRTSEVDVPPLVIDLPDKKMIVDPDIVRVKITCEFRGIVGVVDFKLESISQETRISNQVIKYAVVKSTATFDRLDGKVENTAEYWLSPQIPGGIVKTIQIERIGEHTKTRMATVVDFSHVAKK